MGFIDYGLLPCLLAWIGMSLFLEDKKTSLTDTNRNCTECVRDKAKQSRDVVYPACPEHWAVFHFVHDGLDSSASRISMGQVIVIFLVAITKWLMRDNFRKKGFILAQSLRGDSPWRQGRHRGKSEKLAGQTTPQTGCRERWMLVLNVLSPFHSAQDTSPWNGTIHIGTTSSHHNEPNRPSLVVMPRRVFPWWFWILPS